MIKVVICLNGEKLKNYDFSDADYIIACDGGYSYLQSFGIDPDFVLGDFDSLGYFPDNAIVYPCDKDYTDGELGLLKAKSLQADTVEFICAGGKRDDQFFANVGLLEKAYKLGISATVVTNAGKIYFNDSDIEINVEIGQIISVYPLSTAIVEKSYGLKYPYCNTKICRGDTLGISNVATTNKVKLSIKEGEVLVFVNNSL